MKTKLILLSTLLLFSCGRKENERKFILSASEDDNWTTTSIIGCDSVQMINKNHVYYYIDGHKFSFYSNLIKIRTNE